MFTELLYELEFFAALGASINEPPRIIETWAVVNGIRVGIVFPNEMLLQLLYGLLPLVTSNYWAY